MEKMLKDIFFNYSDTHSLYAIESEAKIKDENDEVMELLSSEMQEKYLHVLDSSVETAFFHGFKCAMQLVLQGAATK
ncbi:MAG: hypothetical protein ACI4YB_01965 [Oscillospiraceae bacterium]